MILVSNDDGVWSDGLKELVKALKKVGRVVVVAPDREQSASSHALTLQRPLRLEKISKDFYSVDGTPADCVNLAVNGLLKKSGRPQLLVSGINNGANLGDDITYSGTVSAAKEGTLLGMPSIAISVARRSNGGKVHYLAAARFAAKIARKILKQGLPQDVFLNINVPDMPPSGVKSPLVTFMGKRIYPSVIVEKVDPRGKKYYWIGGGKMSYEKETNSDFDALAKKHISVTPLHLNMTSYSAMEGLAKIIK